MTALRKYRTFEMKNVLLENFREHVKNEQERCTTLPACNAGTSETSVQNENIPEETTKQKS